MEQCMNPEWTKVISIHKSFFCYISQVPQAKANCMLFQVGVLGQPPNNHDEPQRVEGVQTSVTDSSPELSQVRWTSHPDASGMKAL